MTTEASARGGLPTGPSIVKMGATSAAYFSDGSVKRPPKKRLGYTDVAPILGSSVVLGETS